MARLGIDFGTTNSVVVCSDRGRYPVVPHFVQTAIGRVFNDVFPSVVAFEHDTGEFVYGPDAERALARPGAEKRYSVMRSLSGDGVVAISVSHQPRSSRPMRICF